LHGASVRQHPRVSNIPLLLKDFLSDDGVSPALHLYLKPYFNIGHLIDLKAKKLGGMVAAMPIQQ
jgi:hypothetical protein